MKIAFLLHDLQLSGGVGVVVRHARELATRHGHDVTLVLTREQEQEPWEFDGLAHLHVEGLSEARGQRFDVAIATWWETTFSLFELEATRYASFVQSLEDRFYPPNVPERTLAALTQSLPVAYVTEARWIADTLAELQPESQCLYVRNGIDKQVFAPPAELEVRLDGPLRIVVEGNPQVWFKGVPAALGAVARMREPRHLTLVAGAGTAPAAHGRTPDAVVGPLSQQQMARLYADSDVVLKLSRVEGMYGPPLEGFHMGATCVTTPVTGHEEYVEHGWNGLVVDWDDEAGTARALDLLARDRRLLHFLRTNALATARAWPSWEQAGTFMAGALAAIERAPAPPSGGARQLMADACVQLEHDRKLAKEHVELRRAARLARLLRRIPGVRLLLRARHHRVGRALLRPLRPLARRLLR
ncbi:MAG: glycosyltransferase family 4 protein [Actinobacteria bacterium]|nr:glycosyltransferase family 4 protein [Actinomycetota bacterium]